MTIANAFKLFFKALNGSEPAGANIADVVREGASKMNAASDSIVLKSSTASSTKSFAITVDDTGEITATEISA